jgi:hypothetical protein
VSLTDDESSMLTEEQLRQLQSAIAGTSRVEIKMIGNRPAICQKDGEPLQFIVSGNAMMVRHMATGWSEHLESLQKKARGW